jgi:hypothetical protein
MKDIGYHAIFQVNGTLEWGRPLTEDGAHVMGHNTKNLGFCFIGTDKFTIEQFRCARNLWTQTLPLMVKDLVPWEIYGHCEFDTAKAQGKTCPNMDIKRLAYWLYFGDRNAILPYLLEATPK